LKPTNRPGPRGPGRFFFGHKKLKKTQSGLIAAACACLPSWGSAVPGRACIDPRVLGVVAWVRVRIARVGTSRSA